MPKLFGEFLVEKGLIQAQDMVAALVEQISKLPTLVEIVYRARLLSSESILVALRLQVRERKDFRSACIGMGVWTPAVEAAVEQELESHRIPVGQILLSQKKLGLKDLATALDEFISLYSRGNPQTSIDLAMPVSRSAEPASA